MSVFLRNVSGEEFMHASAGALHACNFRIDKLCGREVDTSCTYNTRDGRISAITVFAISLEKSSGIRSWGFCFLLTLG